MDREKVRDIMLANRETDHDDLNKINEADVNQPIDLLKKTSDILETLVWALEDELDYMRKHGWDKAGTAEIGYERWILANKLYNVLEVGPGNVLAMSDDVVDQFEYFIAGYNKEPQK
jgi:hypothetical protein